MRVSARFVWDSIATFASESPFRKNAKVAQESRTETRVKPRKTPIQLDRRSARKGRLLRRFNRGPPPRTQKQNSLARGDGQESPIAPCREPGRPDPGALIAPLAQSPRPTHQPRRIIPNRRPRSAARIRQNVPIDARPCVVAMTVAWLAQLRRTVVPLAPIELAAAGAAAQPIEHRTTATSAAIVGAARAATVRAIGAVASCSARGRRRSAIAAA
jgi:hypothetical protein